MPSTSNPSRHSWAALAGFVFGVVTPLVGVFLGLQVAPLLGTIFAFPLIAAGWLMGEPFGHLSAALRFAALLASGAVWAAIFWSVARVLRARPTA